MPLKTNQGKIYAPLLIMLYSELKREQTNFTTLSTLKAALHKIVNTPDFPKIDMLNSKLLLVVKVNVNIL